MLKYEFKKYILKPSCFICIIILLILNFIKCFELFYYFYGGKSLMYFPDTAERQIHSIYGGEITEEKINMLKEDIKKAEENLAKFGYSVTDAKDSYSGSYAKDKIILDTKKEQYRYAVLYGNFSEEIRRKAMENVEFYNGKSEYDKCKNELLARIFSGRKIDECILQTGWNVLFDYKFSTLLCMLAIILVLSPICCEERETGLYKLIISSKKRLEVLKVKLFTSAIFTVLLSLVFLLSDVLYVYCFYRPDGLFAPVYALMQYKASPFDITIFEGIVMAYIARTAFLLLFSFMVCFISSASKTSGFSAMLSAAAGFATVIISEHIGGVCSPLSLVGLSEEFSELSIVNIIGFPVLSLIPALLITLTLCFAFAVLTLAFGLRGSGE